MLLSQSQVKALKEKTCKGCRGATQEDLEYLYESYGRLVEIIMKLKGERLCWCFAGGAYNGPSEEHTQLCRDIKRIYT